MMNTRNYTITRSQIITAVLLSAALAGPIRAQSNGDDARLIAAIRRFVPEVMSVYGTRGIELAVARHNEVILTQGFGYADIARRIPMTDSTIFAAGSMSKTYTATAIMQLVEQGILSLDEPINTYLKKAGAFQIVNPLGEREITVRDLMSHRAGITSDAAGSELSPPAPLLPFLRDEYASKMLYSYEGTSLPLWSAKVGEKFQYSNIGVATLGLLVEITNPEHLTFDKYIDRHIFEPLGMHSSEFPPLQDAAHLKPDLARRFARGYAKLGPVDLPSPQIYLGDYPAGTFVSMPGDHIRLLLAYMSGGEYHGARILKPETVKLMLTEGATKSLGLIWWLYNQGKPDFGYGHGGAYMFGWRNEFRAYPTLDLATVVATNQWDMMATNYGSSYDAVMDFISSWVRHEHEGLRHPQADKPWAWKRSYVIGMVWVDQIMGALGTHTPLSDADIDAAARDAAARGGVARDSVFDPDGFRAGANDLRHVPIQVDSVRAFVNSDRVRVLPEELNLIYASLGAPKNWIPMPEFAPAR